MELLLGFPSTDELRRAQAGLQAGTYNLSDDGERLVHPVEAENRRAVEVGRRAEPLTDRHDGPRLLAAGYTERNLLGDSLRTKPSTTSHSKQMAGVDTPSARSSSANVSHARAPTAVAVTKRMRCMRALALEPGHWRGGRRLRPARAAGMMAAAIPFGGDIVMAVLCVNRSVAGWAALDGRRRPVAGSGMKAPRISWVRDSQFMALAAGITVPSILQSWSEWLPLRGAGSNGQFPALPGLYRVRRTTGQWGLDYVGQTGRSLRGRLGQLNVTYRAEMPYADPHTAAPALWAMRHRDGCDFEASVIEVTDIDQIRRALEATAITLYRMESGRSPAANFGRMPAGYRKSTGNNAQLVASGRRLRGGPDPQVPIAVNSAPVSGELGTDPDAADWMDWAWSPWTPVSEAGQMVIGTGLLPPAPKWDAGACVHRTGRYCGTLALAFG